MIPFTLQFTLQVFQLPARKRGDLNSMVVRGIDNNWSLSEETPSTTSKHRRLVSTLLKKREAASLNLILSAGGG